MKYSNIILMLLSWTIASIASPIPLKAHVNDINAVNVQDPMANNNDIHDVFQKPKIYDTDLVYDISSESENPDDEMNIIYYDDDDILIDSDEE